MFARVDGHLDLKRTVGFLRTVRNGKLVTVTGNRHTMKARYRMSTGLVDRKNW